MVKYSDDVEFLRKRQEQGLVTQLDELPDLDHETGQLWNIYACLSDDILGSVHLYDQRIGLPHDWYFEEVLGLMSSLSGHRQKLADKERNG